MIKLHFLNVGHGDCTIIEHDSERITMIDINNSTTLPEEDEIALAEDKGISLSAFRSTAVAKNWEQYYKDKLVDPVAYWRDNFGGKSLFRYIQTHPDMDHMGGLASLFWGEKVPLLNFWDTSHSKKHVEKDFDNSPHEWLDWLAYKVLRDGRHGADGEHVVHHKLKGHTGSYWSDDGLAVLGPTSELVAYCDRIEKWNNASQVFRLDYGGRRVILPGDAEKPAWDAIEAEHDAQDLKCDILKAAHHGRESGYSESAVDLMDPSVVICSVGKKPSTDASDEYKHNHGSTVLSTRYNGTITVTIWYDGEVWVDASDGTRLTSLPPL